MKNTLSFLAIFAAIPALAEQSRELDAHEHGVGALNIAVDGSTVAMEFHAPGADIVGFEYEAKTDADKAAVEAAIKTLGAPLDLFVLPDAASCSVTEVHAELESEDDHHDHDEEHHDEHADEDHKEHDDEHHDDHEDEAGHTEFHAEYVLNCDAPDALTTITFAYFDMFENAKEVEVQIVSASGAGAFEVERDASVLQLEP